MNTPTAYSAPQVEVLGSLSELTRGSTGETELPDLSNLLM